jgi:hypothetical protein
MGVFLGARPSMVCNLKGSKFPSSASPTDSRPQKITRFDHVSRKILEYLCSFNFHWIQIILDLIDFLTSIKINCPWKNWLFLFDFPIFLKSFKGLIKQISISRKLLQFWSVSTNIPNGNRKKSEPGKK